MGGLVGGVLSGAGVGRRVGVVIEVTAGAEVAASAARHQQRNARGHVLCGVAELGRPEHATVVENGVAAFQEVLVVEAFDELLKQAHAPAAIVEDLCKPGVETIVVGTRWTNAAREVTERVADVVGRVHRRAGRRPWGDDVADLQVGDIGEATADGCDDDLHMQRANDVARVIAVRVDARWGFALHWRHVELGLQRMKMLEVRIDGHSVVVANDGLRLIVVLQDPVHDGAT